MQVISTGRRAYRFVRLEGDPKDCSSLSILIWSCPVYTAGKAEGVELTKGIGWLSKAGYLQHLRDCHTVPCLKLKARAFRHMLSVRPISPKRSPEAGF